MSKVVALPLYKPQKGADQGEEEQKQSLDDLGTGSHGLMDKEAITRMSSLHWTNVTRMLGTLKIPSTFLNQMIFKNLKI